MLRLSRLSLFLVFPLVLSAYEGYASLKIATGAREAAMGETGVAGAKGADAMRWNPALLVQGSALELSLNHNLWLIGTSQSALLLKRRFGRVALGAEVLYFASGEIELRDSTAGDPKASYTFADLSFGLGAALEVIDGTRIGIVGRFYNERLWNYRGSTWGFDAGLSYNVLEGVELGFSVMDLGFDTRLAADAFKPPMTIRLGSALSRSLLKNLSTSLNLDFLYRPYSKEPGLRTGAEVRLFDLLALRAGAKFLYASEDKVEFILPTELVTFGIGIAHKGISVDYALVPYERMGLGLTHRISVNLSFD